MLQGAIYGHIFVINEFVALPQALFLFLKCMSVIIDDLFKTHMCQKEVPMAKLILFERRECDGNSGCAL